MQIFLIRHGQSTGDIENRFGGTYDDHLTDEGKIQAERVANKLHDKKIETIYYSPLIRSKETALILQKKIRSQLEVVQAFKERNTYGILSGMEKHEAEKTYPQLVTLLENEHNTIIDAEPYDVFRDRVLAAFQVILDKKHQSIALITHGGPIKLLIKEIFNKKINNVNDCGYLELKITVDQALLTSYDGVSFL